MKTNIRDVNIVTGVGAVAPNIVMGLHYTPDTPDAGITGFDEIKELYERSYQRIEGEKFKWRRMSRAVSGYNTNIGPGGRIYLPALRMSARNFALDVKCPYGRVNTDDPAGDPYGITAPVNDSPERSHYYTLFGFSEFDTGLATIPKFMPNVYCDIVMWYDVEFFQPVLSNET